MTVHRRAVLALLAAAGCLPWGRPSEGTARVRPRPDALVATYRGRGVTPLPDSVRRRFNLDTTFYARFASANGIPVIASARVPDEALLVARDIVNHMLVRRPDLRAATDPLAISGQRLDGRRGFPQERGVDDARMATRDGAELMRQREGEEILRTGEQPGPGPRQPVVCPILLARGTMPVAAGMVVVLHRTAGVAAGDRAPHRGGATRGNVRERATLGRQQSPGVALKVRRPRGADDVRERDHRGACRRVSGLGAGDHTGTARSCNSPLMGSVAVARNSRVTWV